MKAIIWVPVTTAMVVRAYKHNSLTPAGIVAAVLTAVAHAVHPWSLPFALLIVFFLAGTRATKVKHDLKAKLTMQSTGSAGGESARTHVQVLANSLPASIFSLLHAYQLSHRPKSLIEPKQCYSYPGDLLVVGIIANYACVAADTFSSELGILSKSHPRLITSLSFRKVPPGTNGGVTGTGLASGFLGSLIMTATTVALLPFCAPPTVRGAEGWNLRGRNRFAFAMALWGALGSVVDSLLGGWLQSSVVDTRTGKIVEGEGGKRVLVSKDSGRNSMHVKKSLEVKKRILNGEGKEATAKQVGAGGETVSVQSGSLNENVADDLISEDKQPSRVVESGKLGLLDNNEVNFLMASGMSIGAMAIASWFWGVPLSSVFDFTAPEEDIL